MCEAGSPQTPLKGQRLGNPSASAIVSCNVIKEGRLRACPQGALCPWGTMALWPLADNPQGSHRSAGQRPMSSHGLKPSSKRKPSTQQRVCGRRQAFAHVPHLYTYAHYSEPTPRAQTSNRARIRWLGLQLDSLKPDLLS